MMVQIRQMRGMAKPSATAKLDQAEAGVNCVFSAPGSIGSERIVSSEADPRDGKVKALSALAVIAIPIRFRSSAAWSARGLRRGRLIAYLCDRRAAPYST